MPTTLTDEEIVSRILNGEKNLYEILIRKFNLRLFRLSMSIVNDDKEILRGELSSYYKSNQHFEFNLVRCDRIVNAVLAKVQNS